MPYALRLFSCIDCGRPDKRRVAAGTPQRCRPCAVEYAAEAARQMHAKQGPIYVRWVWSQATRYARMTRQLSSGRARRAA